MPIIEDVRGTGPTKVVVVSGWYGRETIYDGMWSGIDFDAFSLAMVDFRGYGARKGEKGEYTLEEIAGDVVAGAEELGWDSFGIVGHSMGGPVAALVASALPDKVTKYFGISPAPPGGMPLDEGTRAFFVSATESLEARAGIIGISTGNVLPSAWVNGLAASSAREADPVAFGKYFEAFAGANAADAFSSLKIPICVVSGENDLAITPEVVNGTYGTLQPDAEIKFYANCGHYAMSEVPLRLAGDLQDFFGDAKD